MLIYRIAHIDNLEYILQQGCLVSPNHINADRNYTKIGNNSVIERRSKKVILEVGNLSFRDYVAFYFGPRSIMLFNIKTGYNVPQIPQNEIIYFTYDVDRIIADGYDFFFTDGNGANIPITKVFTDLNDLSKVDMKIACTKDFSPQACKVDPDLKRKKHAEFHLKDQLTFNDLHNISVYNVGAETMVKKLLAKYGSMLAVQIDKTL